MGKIIIILVVSAMGVGMVPSVPVDSGISSQGNRQAKLISLEGHSIFSADLSFSQRKKDNDEEGNGLLTLNNNYRPEFKVNSVSLNKPSQFKQEEKQPQLPRGPPIKA